MKIKTKDPRVSLPNCWKACGVGIEDWGKLKSGEEIEVKAVPEAIETLVDVSSQAKSKGDK